MVSSTAYPFGRSGVRCAPLTVDRVTDEFSSPLPLFRLPLELYNNVTTYLDSKDLKSLSLVDRDCLKLARCSQFADVRVGRESTDDFLASLNGLTLHGECTSSSLGVYVRRITVCNQKTTYYEALGASASVQRLLDINFQALPNLHVLDLSTCTPEQALFTAIASSSVRHLRLSGMKFHHDFALSESTGTWELETLALDFSYIPAECPSGTTLLFVNSILRAVAGTLRQLVWKGEKIIRWQRWSHSFPEDMPSFPNLRHLVLDSVLMEDNSVLSRFLGPDTRIDTLCMDSMGPCTSEFLLQRGYVSTLQNFCWINHFLSSHVEVILFIQNNPQIRTFDIANPLPSVILSPLVQTLADSLCLSSLSLTWAESVIPPESLAVIGSMKTLQHLWLSAGSQYGKAHDWEINHTALLTELKPLTHLKTIAFSRDSYRVQLGHCLRDCSVSGYYTSQSLPATVIVSDYLSGEEIQEFPEDHPNFDSALMARTKRSSIAWERWHAERMTGIAKIYAAELQDLQWCFVGQYPFEVACGSERNVIRLSDARDCSLTSLKRKWGLVDEN